jgi:hypothetical protein
MQFIIFFFSYVLRDPGATDRLVSPADLCEIKLDLAICC